MLCGVPSARRGSKRRGIHSHSWTKRKNVRTAVRCPALDAVRAFQPPSHTLVPAAQSAAFRLRMKNQASSADSA